MGMGRLPLALLAVAVLLAGCGGSDTTKDPTSLVPATGGLQEKVRAAQGVTAADFPAAGGRTLQEVADHLVVGQLGEPLELELPGQHMLGQRAQVDDLGAREARRGAQRLGVLVEDLLWRRDAPVEVGEQLGPDRPRREHGELLAGDRAHERAVEVGRAPAAVALLGQRAAEVVDQRRHDRVTAEVVVGAQETDRASASGAPSSAERARSTEVATHVKVGVSRLV